MKLSREAIRSLAGEYVLGTLRGRARKRFETHAAADASIADEIRRWEDALMPLASGIPSIAPPTRVWQAIESRVGPHTADRVPHTASFWRAFGMLAGGMATVLVAFFVYISTGVRGEPSFVAVLTAPDAAPRMVVSMHQPGILRVRMVKPWGGVEGKALELWVLPKDGKPRSLGMVANDMRDTMMKISYDDPRVQDMASLAVSLEPPGGSPTGLPTGPVLCAGPVAPVKRNA